MPRLRSSPRTTPLLLSCLGLCLCLFLAACADRDDQDVPYAPVDDDGVALVHIRSDDLMRFEPTRFRVRPGQQVRLRLEHVGRMSVVRMGHNVVILEPGEDPEAFAREAVRQGGNLDNDYLPHAMRDRVVAFTAMIGGGESDTIAFEAPGPGRYPFVCTFPGHHVMTGVMIVE